MSTSKPIPVKYFYYGMIGCVIFISTVFVYLGLKESKNEKALDENGVIVSAWIIDLKESKVSKKSNSNYYMQVGFFKVNGNNNKANELETVVDSNKNESDKLIENLSKLTAGLRQPSDDYEMQTIPINGYDIFKKYKINDKVKIQYLPDNPSVLRLVND